MGVSQTLCPGWPQTTILLISASQVASIIDVSHQCLASCWMSKYGQVISSLWVSAYSAVRMGMARFSCRVFSRLQWEDVENALPELGLQVRLIFFLSFPIETDIFCIQC
jgi:hypothetical protein